MGIAPLETSDVFASAHELLKQKVKWSKGARASEPPSAIAFLAPLLPLFFACELPENAPILDYDVIRQFRSWVAYVVSKNPQSLEILKLSKRQRALVESITPQLPRALLALSSLPSSWEEHTLRSQLVYNTDSDEEEDELPDEEEDAPEAGPSSKAGPSKKPAGTLLYFLSGAPSNMRLNLPVVNPDPHIVPKVPAKPKRGREESPPIKVEKGADPPKNKRSRLRSPTRSRIVLSPTPEPIVISDYKNKTTKKAAGKPKPRPTAPKGGKKATASTSASAKDPLPPSSAPGPTTTNSVLDPAFQTLSSSAISIYSIIAPKSALLTDPEAATVLTTRATTTPLPRMPCRHRACMENPQICLPYDGNSKKCAPCQNAHAACSFQRHRNDTPLHDRLRGFWDFVQGPSSTAYVNCLYDELRQEWRHLQDLTALVNHQASRVEGSRRFLSAYLQTLKHNDDPFVDEMVDAETLKVLIQQHPGAVYEQLCAVAPLANYFHFDPQSPASPTAGTANEPTDASPPAYQDPSAAQAATLPFGFAVPASSNAFAPPPTFGSSFSS
ncbi:hypothetical protein EST38_g14388 [Candolleomyces aberdarensis]|uniref:Uncharacterized protein n=1 Tax=Candolleomyces aberdarensis TaxID=2316362 RepID=A0A4Q2CXE4_9AGAR|nr:hypothetical protein EST38_g14388 [Candolleomyces aberdarensis]